MAYLNTTTAPGNTFAPAASFFESIAQRYKRHRIYRTTFNELSALSDRDLSDLGMHRSLIRNTAQEAAADAKI